MLYAALAIIVLALAVYFGLLRPAKFNLRGTFSKHFALAREKSRALADAEAAAKSASK